MRYCFIGICTIQFSFIPAYSVCSNSFCIHKTGYFCIQIYSGGSWNGNNEQQIAKLFNKSLCIYIQDNPLTTAGNAPKGLTFVDLTNLWWQQLHFGCTETSNIIRISLSRKQNVPFPRCFIIHIRRKRRVWIQRRSGSFFGKSTFGVNYSCENGSLDFSHLHSNSPEESYIE